MKLLVPALLAALASPAFADGNDTAQLGDGYTLVVQNWGVHVVKGKQRARIADGVSIVGVKVDKKARKVDADIEDSSCTGDTKYTWTFGHLDARLENTSAYALHKKKDYANAALGFARAVAADATWNIPAYNLASAQQLAGNKDEAIKALAPWLASAPVTTYVHVTADPELSPLLDRPELKAIRAATPGNATVTAKNELDGGIAYSKDKGLIAVSRMEGSWGGCGYGIDLELRDAKTGRVVATTPIVAWADTNECDVDQQGPGISKKGRVAVGKRIKALTAMLRELGFAKLKTERGTEGSAASNGSRTLRFAKAKIGVVDTDGTARALIKDKELGTTTTLEHLTDGYFVEDPKMVVLWSLRPGREGCEGTDPTDVSVIQLAP